MEGKGWSQTACVPSDIRIFTIALHPRVQTHPTDTVFSQRCLSTMMYQLMATGYLDAKHWVLVLFPPHTPAVPHTHPAYHTQATHTVQMEIPTGSMPRS